MVLLASLDASCRFIYADVDDNGTCSDAGIFMECGFYQAIESGNGCLPDQTPLPGDDTPIPYHIVDDDAFALRS